MNTDKADISNEPKQRQLEKAIDKNGRVKMQLAGKDGNAFAILGRFRKKARRQGWSKSDIETVTNMAQSGDYNHLLNVISQATDGI